jgi:hypothetical protein
MAMVARILEEPVTTEPDEDGIRYRSVKVRLANGQEPTAFIHDSPGDQLRYKPGDRVRLSINRAGNEPESDDGRAGFVVIGKFGDDFEPQDDKNREIHGPSDGNLYLDSRQLLELFGKTGVEVWGRNVYLYPSSADGLVQLGEGATSTMKPLAIHEEVRGDIDRTYGLLDASPTGDLGVLLLAIRAAIIAGGGSDIQPFIDDFLLSWTAAEPVSLEAHAVVANSVEEES